MLGHVTRLVLLAATVLTAIPAGAAPPPPEGPLGPPRRALVAKLEALATWCDGNRLPGERDRVFRRILTLDPDHARARAGLKYKRADKASPWTQASEYSEPADGNKGQLAEAKKRRAEAAKAFRAAAKDAMDAAGVAAEDGAREEASEVSLDVAPEDAEFRRERGDVEVDGAWVLPETVEARRRRVEFARMRKEARLGPIQEDPKALADKWKGGAISEHFTTWGVVPSAECLEEVRLRELGLAFMTELFGPVDAEPTPRLVVLFPDHKTARRWLESDPEYAPVLKESELVGAMMLPDGVYASWQSEGNRKVSALTDLLFAHLWRRLDGNLRSWVGEGLCQRICRHVAGRHGAASVDVSGTNRPTADDEDDGPPLDGERRWLPHAAAALQRDPARRMRAVLTMNLNAMRRADVLTAYALGAYLLEGRPEALAPLVKASAKIDDADKACREALGVDAATLAWRVRRWVLEAGAD
jgi:hypothetical protein